MYVCKLSLQSWKRIQKAFGGETGHTLDPIALDSNAPPDFDSFFHLSTYLGWLTFDFAAIYRGLLVCLP